MMEPTIKIEEDSTAFGEFPIVAEDQEMEDDSACKLKKRAPRREVAHKRTMDVAESYQPSIDSTIHRKLVMEPFPISTVNELNEFDMLLLESPSYTEKCAQMLHSTVREEGYSFDNVTCHMRQVLEHAIDYGVLVRYSWHGYMPRSPAARRCGDQHSFRGLLGVISLLHRTRQLRFATCSREEINDGIERFLKRKLRCRELFLRKTANS